MKVTNQNNNVFNETVIINQYKNFALRIKFLLLKVFNACKASTSLIDAFNNASIAMLNGWYYMDKNIRLKKSAMNQYALNNTNTSDFIFNSSCPQISSECTLQSLIWTVSGKTIKKIFSLYNFFIIYLKTIQMNFLI